MGPGAESITISSLEQLDCSVAIRLVLVTLRQATSGEQGAIGLNALAARIEGLIAASPEALNTFKERLLEAGYVEHEFYETVLFEHMSSISYRVAAGFPKLTRGMVPEGIASATYAININSISEYRDDLLK